MAGPEVMRSGAPSSLAMIIASVVLPSPGEPDSSTWSGGRLRARAASSTSESCSRTRSCPTNSSSRLGRSAASTTSSSPSAYGETTSGTVIDASGPAQQSQARAQQSGDVGHVADCERGLGLRPDRGERLVDLARAPAESGQGRAQLLAPGTDPGLAGQPRRARTAPERTGELVLELEHQPLGALAAYARHQGQRADVLAGDRGAHRIGAVHGEHGLGELGADAAD